MINFFKNKGFTPHLLSKKGAGFTLLELLVSIGIFAVVMTTASGIFGTALQNQERMLTQQLAISNTSYALEYMSRAARMAKKDVDGQCIQAGCNFTNPDGEQSVRFLTHDDRCVEFSLEGGQIKRRKSEDVHDEFDGTHAFTSDDLNIQDLRFELKGECQGDQQQPTVTILINAETGEEVEFQTQTTVTQRNLDVPK